MIEKINKETSKVPSIPAFFLLKTSSVIGSLGMKDD